MMNFPKVFVDGVIRGHHGVGGEQQVEDHQAQHVRYVVPVQEGIMYGKDSYCVINQHYLLLAYRLILLQRKFFFILYSFFTDK